MTNNNAGSILRIIGVLVIVCGAIVGIYMMQADATITGVVYIVAGLVSGMVFVGFAEIIKLLQLSVDAQDELLKEARKITAQMCSPKKAQQPVVTKQPPKVSVISFEEEEKTVEVVPTETPGEILCPNCNKRQKSDRKKCFYCGVSFERGN